jgi:hypothetical protein
MSESTIKVCTYWLFSVSSALLLYSSVLASTETEFLWSKFYSTRSECWFFLSCASQSDLRMEQSYSTNLYTKLVEGYVLTFDNILSPRKVVQRGKRSNLMFQRRQSSVKCSWRNLFVWNKTHINYKEELFVALCATSENVDSGWFCDRICKWHLVGTITSVWQVDNVRLFATSSLV